MIANLSDADVVLEFFELFKTPWEPYVEGRQYDVVLYAGGDQPLPNGKLVLVYGNDVLPCDREEGIEISSMRPAEGRLLYNGTQIPLYKGSATLHGGTRLLVDAESGQPVTCFRQASDRAVVRIGYSLFEEVRFLLNAGQPAVNAAAPTLDLHIAVLLDLIVSQSVTLMEIPPVPYGYRFIACLTHDIDHPFLRRHQFDRTMWGFLYRATAGSLARALRGRLPLRDLVANWIAVFKLPLVYLGLVEDFWSEFDRYVELEGSGRSTFFVIPYANCPGAKAEGFAPAHRAAAYGAADLVVQMHRLASVGCEIGVHGIDAWIDSTSGRAEMEEIQALAGPEATGIRMHWLYFDELSPERLEHAGACYDSTVGYNEAIGYRAGTTQVYKPLSAAFLLELPLHIMDTALFYPNYLNLTPREAHYHTDPLLDHAAQSGGCLTINWHDRSIAPERNWSQFYLELLKDLGARGAWFATAAETVAWFRKRRSATFESAAGGSDAIWVRTDASIEVDSPDLQIRVHYGKNLGSGAGQTTTSTFRIGDSPFHVPIDGTIKADCRNRRMD